MTSHGKGCGCASGTTAGTVASSMLAGAGAAIIAAAYLLPFWAANNESIRTFSLIFSSIMLEAAPFMLLGTVAGGLIEVFVSRERMESLLPGKDWFAACVAAAMGMIFPVCECAIVPVVRRLAGKGLPAAAAVAYLLAGPIVNPVVGLSTVLAYNFDWRPAVFRLVAGYVIAVVASLLLTGTFFRRKPLFADGVLSSDPHACGCSCGCGHGHEHGHHHAPNFLDRIADAGNHALDDFMATAPYLIIGAALAAAAQTGIERRLFVEAASSPAAAMAAMMLLAVLLNLCSEADAFIAASFRGLVPFSSQMAFLVIGPMFDIKLLLMYRSLFRRGVAPILAGLVAVAVALLALGMEMTGVS